MTSRPSRAAAVLALLAALAAGCGSEPEGGLEASILRQVRTSHPEATAVRCADGPRRAGAALDCTAEIGPAAVPLVVTFTDDRRFTYTNPSNVLRRADLERTLVERARGAGFTTASVTCADQPVFVVRDLARAGCTATVAGAEPFPLAVTGTDPDRVDVRPGVPYIALAATEVEVARRLDAALGLTGTTVECGDREIFTGAVGAATRCTTREPSGRVDPLTLTITGPDGQFGYERR